MLENSASPFGADSPPTPVDQVGSRDAAVGAPPVIVATLRDRLSFAGYQNDVPVLAELRIDNPGPDQLSGARLDLNCEPPLLRPRSWTLDRVAAGGSVRIRDLKVDLVGGELAQLKESLRAEVTLALTNDRGELVATSRSSVVGLARNEWGGGQYEMPQLLGAFVMPNDPAVSILLRTAADVLERAGHKKSFEGYQAKDRSRVWQMASAIWSAVGARGWVYAEPPASFEQNGQKVRTPSDVLRQGLATCLDTTLLFAAALEAAGLHAIAVFTDGHVFPGVWLQPHRLGDLQVFEAGQLRKHLQLNELIVFESTLAMAANRASFSEAIQNGAKQLAEAEELRFRHAIDFKRVRDEKIRPLDLSSDGTVPVVKPLDAGDSGPSALEAAPELGAFDADAAADAPAPETPKDRLERWKLQLLDLTKRNRLLNLKESVSAIKLDCPDVGALEDGLSRGDRFRFHPLKQEGDTGEARDVNLYARSTGRSLDQDVLQSVFDRGELAANLSKPQLTNGLTALYRKAKADLAEGGANTLFLAIGMLKWRETPQATRSYRAPLILLPVTLERRSANSPFSLRGHADPTVFNLTLLELLRRDFALRLPQLEGDLPQDEHGVNVQAIFETLRRAVREMPGFEVVDELVLSTFSFAKFLMWKDLDANIDAMRRSRLIRHFIDDPRACYPHSASPTATRDLDRMIDPANLFLPMSADGSQIAAVHASEVGGDLVLEGPPGTGKSQTIANLIAHNMALGRSILFVSEKRTALDQVYERLNKAGLGNFCLQLHSNKSNKKDVLDQLKVAWRDGGVDAAERWSKSSQRVRELTEVLNGTVEALHRPVATGLTPHVATGRVIQARGDDTPAIKLDWGAEVGADPARDPEGLAERQRAVGELADAARHVSAADREAFTGINYSAWSNGWQDEACEALAELATAADALREAAMRLVHDTGLPFKRQDARGLKRLAAFTPSLGQANVMDLGFALTDDAETQFKVLRALAELSSAFGELRSRLSQPVSDQAHLDPRIPEWNSGWKRAGEAIGPIRLIQSLRIQAKVNALATAGTGLRPEEDLPLLMQMKDVEQRCDDLRQRLVPGHPWEGLRTDPAKLKKKIQIAETVRALVDQLATSPLELSPLRAAARALLVDGKALVKPNTPLRILGDELYAASKRYDVAQMAWQRLAQETLDRAQSLEVIAARCRRRLDAWPRIRVWCRWIACCETAGLLRLDHAVEALAEGEIAPEAARAAFDVGYARWLAPKVLDADIRLRTFYADQHHRYLREFRDLLEQREAEAAAVIRHRLRRGVPDFDDPNRPEGYNLIHRQLQRQRGHMPVRELLEKADHAVRHLTPCVLMSPMSVAQYVSASRPPFDLVVFDEASQICVWDAIGALARGQNAVIVGDPKQMPPTSFFQKGPAPDGEDDGGEVEDLESILDEAMAGGVRTHRLTGHYRSRHESLIAFSNHRYYDSELVTYPSADTAASAVSLRVVEGKYQSGTGGGINVPEARALVAEVVRRLRLPEDQRQSIGIVTFNLKQQMQIENLLDDERRADPSLEPFFNEDEVDEPVFVKNLETVQGDQRDVILLSVGYGPTEPGARAMPLNFGPLNKAGGQRRLNVAITRAASEMVIFTSFEPSMIDLNRSKSEGLRDLKHFLEFAQRGPVAIAEAVTATGGPDDFDSPFEAAVAKQLRALGWAVVTQVGVSRFRIDLGVVHPDEPGRFLAGVECDGTTYHRSPTARDRDLVRQSVLEHLGWNLLRVWSTDFFQDGSASMASLHRQLESLLEEDRERQREREVEREETELEPDGVERGTSDPPATLVEERQDVEPNAEHHESSACRGDQIRVVQESEDLRELFYLETYRHTLTELVLALVDREGPILFEVLAKQIAADHQLRCGRKIRDQIRTALGDARTTSGTGDTLVCWASGQVPVERFPFRDTEAYGRRRDWEEVPPPERLDLIKQTLSTSQLAIEPVEAIAQRLGYLRLRASRRRIIDAEIQAIACATRDLFT